ncbi:ArsR/SmtB family transcription factor [Allopontixanthobacter sediminis]|uniref:Metalloregulator ArsR/SmtB family transcription factor n=1 Tax=Allopontixanthobacter sediminis TaxID=1689985 RepID=A0A845AWZ2_9SPHN|nr:metalloregulator ArsR/SmtB family transcription factor [Allopontixanthobacter sediminis]MXP44043.1 metalloregulator ArsR/SmtB family transcription factor [Allopontixanthobacter sediminis]
MRIDSIMRALADPTRLRMMRLLGVMELAVGELAQVLGQSQPRVSRHIGILCDAGLAERHREGSWVFLRAQSAAGRPVVEAVAGLLAAAEEQDTEFRATCEEDRRQLAAIRAARDESAANYFAAHAQDWDRLRSLHSPDAQVEAQLLDALGDAPLGALLDIGTGTGRMAELFAPRAASIVALDKSLDMLRVARAKLQHLPAGGAELVQGDFANLPFAAHRFDTVLLHHVLHFAQDPATAIAEAARVTKPGGRIVIVDFASHEREELRERYAHARLGFSDKAMAELLQDAGYRVSAPLALHGGELVVKIWLGEREAASARQQPKKKAMQ